MSNFPDLKKPSHFFATFFGIGLLPFAPGTWGSFAGLVLFLFLIPSLADWVGGGVTTLYTAPFYPHLPHPNFFLL